MQRLERDEALASHNEQLIEVQRESREIINGKESQIAKYIAGFAKMKKQLSVTQSSVEEVRNSASQVLYLLISITVAVSDISSKGTQGDGPWLLGFFIAVFPLNRTMRCGMLF